MLVVFWELWHPGAPRYTACPAPQAPMITHGVQGLRALAQKILSFQGFSSQGFSSNRVLVLRALALQAFAPLNVQVLVRKIE